LRTELKQAILRSVSPGWSLLTIADVGVPFLLTLDAYESVMLRNDRIFLGGIDVDKHIEKVSAVLELLEYWVELANSSSKGIRGSKNESFQEITTAIASGRLMRKIDDIKQKIEMMPEASRSLLGRLQSIEQNIRRLM
jgi:predicted nucleotidyltransferase